MVIVSTALIPNVETRLLVAAEDETLALMVI